MCCFLVFYLHLAKDDCITANSLRLGDGGAFEKRQPVTAAKCINKSSLFILLPGFIRLLELKPISEQKTEKIFVAPPYCQTECARYISKIKTSIKQSFVLQREITSPNGCLLSFFLFNYFN